MVPNAEYLNEHFDNFLPYDLNITDPVQKKQLVDSMKEFYFHGKDISKDTVEELAQVITY